MNTGNHIFRDYCKADNSDDEENFDDLQSRLYAQIYYAPSTQDEQSQKEITNQESPTDTNTLCANVSPYNGANQTEDSKDFQKSLHIVDTQVIAKDNITPSSDTVIPQDTDVNVAESNTNIVMKEEKETLMDSMDNSTTSKSVKDLNKADCQSKQPKSVNIEHHSDAVDESSDTNVVVSDLSSIKPDDVSNLVLTNEVSQSQISQTNPVDNIMHDEQFVMDKSINSGKRNKEIQTLPESNKKSDELPISCEQKGIQKNHVPVNLLKKYEFAKRFINKLYEEKYRELEKRLHECETGEMPSESNDAGSVITENERSESCEPDETGEESKYTVIEKNMKAKKKNMRLFQLTDSKNDDSDTDESIFEVPIPPKPQPPLINLQDSDEESEAGNENSTSDDSDSSDGKISNTETRRKKTTVSANTSGNDNGTGMNETRLRTSITRHDSESSVSSCSYELEELNQDIVLNCTEIRKGAASLDEIKQMSKNVQKQKNLKSPQSSGNKNYFIDQHNKDADMLQSLDVSNNANSIARPFPECMSFDDDSCIDIPYNKELANATSTDLVPMNVDLTGNNEALEVNITSMNNQVNINKKRHYSSIEEDIQVVANIAAPNSLDNTIVMVQPSTSNNNRTINNQVSTATQQQGPSHPPMSDALKSFYNDPHPHANFNIDAMQRNMSKDPRMWAILDADLMPSPLKRQRFWNVRCNHCHRDGHLRHSCPEPRRPPRCHMCGIQGHTESRCPGKMCLTCGKKQGSFRKTCESCRTFYCTMCNAIGHKSSECPDLWRRYHQTTKTSELQVPRNLTNVMKPANRLFCCNCTKRGHDSSTCREYRWSQHFPTPAHVSNYMTGPKYTEESDNNITKSSTQHTVMQPCPVVTAQVNIPVYDKEKPPMPRADFIPLLESSKLQDSSLDSLLFTKEQLDGAIYKCGAYVGDIRINYCATFQMGNKKGSHVECVSNRKIFPTFLEELARVINFRAIVYSNKNGVLMACIKSSTLDPKPIQKLVYQWATVFDIEKKSRMFTNLPFDRSELVLFIKAKLAKLEECTGDAYDLKRNIDSMKASLKPGMYTADVPQLLHFQSKLNMLINSKPKETSVVERLRGYLSTLESTSGPEPPMILYLNVLYAYNQIFMPYTMLKLDELVRKCYNKMQQLQREEENAKTQQGNKKQPSVSEQTNNTFNITHKGAPTERVESPSQPNYLHTPIVDEPTFQPCTAPDVVDVFGPLVYNNFSDGSLNCLPSIIPFHSDIPINMETATVVPDNEPSSSLTSKVSAQPPPPLLQQLPVVAPSQQPVRDSTTHIVSPQPPIDVSMPPPLQQLPVTPPSQHPAKGSTPQQKQHRNRSRSPVCLPPDDPIVSPQPPIDVSIPSPQIPGNGSTVPTPPLRPPSVSCVFDPHRGAAHQPVHSENEIECIDLSEESNEDLASSSVNMPRNRKLFICDPPQIKRQSSNTQTSKQALKKKKNEAQRILQKMQEERAKRKIIQKARAVVNEAYQFQLSHMDKAAREIEDKIKHKTVTRKHIKTLRRLIILEGLHRKQVKDICNSLK